MADQVNPMGSLASGYSSALLVSAAPRPAPEKTHPAKIADPRSQELGTGPVVEDAKTAEAAMGKLNGRLRETGSELKFQMDKATGRTIFKVVNPSNGEVLLQVPSEEVLAMARNLRALDDQAGASGVLVDKEG